MTVKRQKTKPLTRAHDDVHTRDGAKSKTIREEFDQLSNEAALKKKMEIITPAGFNNRYDEIFKDNPLKKAEEVYELTEAEFNSITGQKRKYKNFDSFRQVRKRIIRGLM